MGKAYSGAKQLFAHVQQRLPQHGLKKCMSVFVIAGAMLGGVSGTAQAMSNTTPQLEQPEQGIASSEYFSSHLVKNLGLGLQPMLSSTAAVTAMTSRCPAFVSWEDYGGARVHAYVDFHPSDLCNGRHVKAAYVRIIRQCGPYYDTGRIYTYTASTIIDTRLYSVSAWILDSPLWWCNTNTYYGYDYF